MRGVFVNPDDVEDCTGTVNCEDPPADLAEGATIDSVPDCVRFVARGCFIGRSSSVDMDHLFVGGGADVADRTTEGRRRIPEVS